MKTLQILGILLSVGMLSASCSDKGGPQYKEIDWLHITTRDAFQGSILSHERKDIVSLLFYGEPTRFLTLLDAKITIYPISKPPCYFGDLTEQGYISMTSLPMDLIYRYSLDLPDCPTNNSFEAELDLLTQHGAYDFYFRIENAKTGIYYQTPIYRLNMVPYGEDPTDWYTTNIEVLKNNPL